ncbi:unnamed protein product [Leptosia nina]|uniref:Bardet-Biedl syndrome 7 protein n=1 Tax=Leptosia nina TaxID=320188 RepID=A0AAV1JQZ5_9NEOP
MEYDLSRIDYTICGITYPDSLKILPSLDEKVQQKFVVGDKNGVLQCLAIKDEEPVVQFKTLPGRPITSVQLGCSSDSHADKTFAASGNEVKGYTRKGKVFLTVSTLVAETITSMCVIGNDLILCSGRTVTHCKDFNEMTSFTCEDRILDVAAFNAPNSTRIRLLLLIANKGTAIADNGHLTVQTHINSGPSRLAVPKSIRPSEICAFYGAANGSIGLISYNKSELKSKCLVDGQGLGSVMCVGWYSNHVGAHLIVGRHDGSIQLYLTNPQNYEDKLQLKYSYFCGEPITSICGGCIGSDEPEVLATTFSGRIFGLRPRRLLSTAAILSNIPAEALATRRLKLENEVARLEKQTANERDKYQKNTRSLQSSLSVPPLLDVQYELEGATKNGWQEARITSPVPLDMLFIYCNNKLDLETDSAGVLSLCPPQNEKSSDILATIRCQTGTRRLWIHMRSTKNTTIIENIKVLIYVLPAGAPRVSRLFKFCLPMLPFYWQHENQESLNIRRCLCEIHVTGTFSVVEVTSWLSEALPGELPRPANSVKFVRSHTLLNTLLSCEYERGSAIFKSDNISTIADLKDIISNCVVRKGLKININYDISENCCAEAFDIIEESFITEYKKRQEKNLKESLRMLDLDSSIENSEAKSFLCSDYLRVWASPDTSDETCFEQLVYEMEKWYKDWCKLSSNTQFSSSEFKVLHQSLKNCDTMAVKSIFRRNGSMEFVEKV